MSKDILEFSSKTVSSIRDRLGAFLIWMGAVLHKEEPEHTGSKKHYLFLLSSLSAMIFLSFFLKYPSHILGLPVEDELLYRQLAHVVPHSNRIPWIRSPLSLFEFYPVSENIGFFMVIGGLAEAVDTDVSYMVWPFMWIQTLLGILGSFIAFHEFKKDIYFAVTGTAVFSLTTRYVTLTDNAFGLRGFFLSLLPFFFWALFRYNNTKQMKDLAMMLVFGMAGLSIHRMGLFLVVPPAAYFIAHLIHSRIKPVHFSIEEKFSSFNVLVLILSGVLLIVAYILSFVMGISKYKTLGRFNPMYLGSSFINYLYTLGFSYGKIVGFLAPLMIIGFLLILFKRHKNRNEYFVLSLSILFLPLAGAYFLVASFLLIVLSIFISYSIFQFVNYFEPSRKKGIAVLLAFIILVSSLGFFYRAEGNFEERRVSRVLASDWETAGVYMKSSGTGDYDIMGSDEVSVGRIRSLTANPRPPFSHMERFDYGEAKLNPIRILIRNPTNTYRMPHWYWKTRQFYNPPRKKVMDGSIEDPKFQRWQNSSDVRYHLLTTSEQSYAGKVNTERNTNPVTTTDSYRYKIYKNEYVAIYYI